MGKRVGKSIRGEDVDFDLLETKQKMVDSKPRVLEVKQREDFVHTKRRGRGRKAVMERLRQNKESREKSKIENTKTAPQSTPAPTQEVSAASKLRTKKKKRRKIVKKDN